jgi:hypothetical protein
MAEQISLTTPEIKPQIATTFYRVVVLRFDWRISEIGITLEGEHAELRSFGYEGDEAKQLMTALNKANLSTKSLHRRVIERLIADGKLVGTPTGTPD